jgi:hypothetical protein
MSRTLWLLSRGYVLRGGADNVEADAGSGGAVFATDDIGGVHYPRTKIALGAADAYDMDLDSGQQTMTNSLPVAIASNQSAIPVTDNSGALTVDNAGTFAVQVDGSALTALQLIDDAIYADDADWTGDTSKHMLVGGIYESSQQTVTDGDVAPIAIDVNGNVRVRVTPAAAFDHGANRDVDTTAEQVNSNSVAAPHGVWIKADPGNPGRVYLGNSDVTAGTDGTTDGWPLDPGEETFLPINNVNLVYAIGEAANNIVYWRTE